MSPDSLFCFFLLLFDHFCLLRSFYLYIFLQICFLFVPFVEARLLQTSNTLHSHLLFFCSFWLEMKVILCRAHQISRHLTGRQSYNEHVYHSVIKRKRETKRGTATQRWREKIIILIGAPSISHSLRSPWHRDPPSISHRFQRCYR